MEIERFIFDAFCSYLIQRKKDLHVFFISPYSKFNKDLNVSIIELRGLTFGFSCFLIDYYKNCKEDKAGFFHVNGNLKLENFTIDFESYNSILYKYLLENDLELGYLLSVFAKSINNCKYVRAESSKKQTKAINFG